MKKEVHIEGESQKVPDINQEKEKEEILITNQERKA